MVGYKFVYNSAAIIMRRNRLGAAQDYIDREVLKRCAPYTPVGLERYQNSGKLLASAEICKRGRIRYTAPFSRHDYYANVNHKRGGNPNARRMWFEVVKANYGKKMLISAAKIAGGKPVK